MTWTKLGDEFGDETIELSDAAFRAHVEALVWSNRKLADLIIPKSLLARVTATSDPFAAAEELVSTGWWQDIGPAYYAGCRFADWQMDRSVIESKREQQAERVRRHRRHKVGDHSLCTDHCSVTQAETRYRTRDGTRFPGTGRVRDGTGTPTTKTSQEEEGSTAMENQQPPEENGNPAPDLHVAGSPPPGTVRRGPLASDARVEQGKPCDQCGRVGSTGVTVHGSRLCAGECGPAPAGVGERRAAEPCVALVHGADR